MAKAIHLVCGHDDRGQPNNMVFDLVVKAFGSGNWDLSDEDAKALVGGWIYVHVTKAGRSYYGGPVSDYAWVKASGVAHVNRVRFRFRPSAVARKVPWRGQDHARAWTGGLVETDQAHEGSAAVLTPRATP